STDAAEMTLPISGLRMSARTNSVRPRRRSISGVGGTVSTPMTRPMDGSAASSAASAPPSHRLTPVTRTTAGGTSVSSLLVAALDARLLQQLAVLLLRHPLAPLLDDRTHVPAPDVLPPGVPDGVTVRSRRAPCEVISSCATRRGRDRPGRSPGVRAYPMPAGPNETRRDRRSRTLSGLEACEIADLALAELCLRDVGVGVAQVVLHRALRH